MSRPEPRGQRRALRIGIDLDDVLVESLPEYVLRFGRRFGCTVPLREAAWEIFRRHPHVSPAALAGFFAELEQSEFLATRPIYPEAAAGVHTLASAGHALFLVTGRLTEHLGHSQRLLGQATLLDRFQALIHRGGMDESVVVYKRRITAAHRLDLLIDDELHVALGVAESGVRVLLVDRPWNQGALPAGITRVSDWARILTEVARQAHGVACG